MLRKYCDLVYILLLTSFTGGLCAEFGLKLTTESPKPKESTQYRFHYFVKDETTGDYKVQEETKQGDSVHGSYTVAEPNGDLRTVTYTAEPGKGFEARVNIQPNASPMKPILEVTTAAYTTPTFDVANETEKPATVSSSTKQFPEVFTTEVINTVEEKTETATNCTLQTNTVTSTVTEESTVASSLIENATSTENTRDVITTEANNSSSFDDQQKEEVLSTEGRDMSVALIEKEIEEALSSMPKLPELLLPNNKSAFKFTKDPEEALLDERITQIARQLAETSLKREYEERKLGHILPISVTPITSSKSYKFRPSEAPVQVLNHVNLVPQYIYRDTQAPPPSFVPFDRFPVIKPVSAVVPTTEVRQTYETPITPVFQKLQRPDNVIEFNQAFRQLIPAMPIQGPPFLQFFPPYVTPTMRPVEQPSPPERPIPVGSTLIGSPEIISYTQKTDKKSVGKF